MNALKIKIKSSNLIINYELKSENHMWVLKCYTLVVTFRKSSSGNILKVGELLLFVTICIKPTRDFKK